jgi:chromosome segregation ATPase
MATRATSPRFRLLLALGCAALPVSLTRAQDDPPPAHESAAVDPQAREAERQTPRQAEREARDRAVQEARRAREAELKALAEQIRERNARIEDEAAREEKEQQARRDQVEAERRKLEGLMMESLSDLALIEVRIEAIREAIKVLAREVAEGEIQAELRASDPANPVDRERLDRVRRVLKRYENALRERVREKAEIGLRTQRAERQLDQFNARMARSTSRGPTARSVAGSVDRLLERLNEEGAIDEQDRRRASDAIGVIEELLDLFRGHDEPDADKD